MNKILVGLLVGGFLGIFDGWSAIWTHPEDQEVRSGIMAIIMMGIFKGLVAGAVMGLVARRTRSVPMGILIGALVGLALAFPVYYFLVGKYFWEIMLPGGIVGTLAGYATQSFGARPRVTAAG